MVFGIPHALAHGELNGSASPPARAVPGDWQSHQAD